MSILSSGSGHLVNAVSKEKFSQGHSSFLPHVKLELGDGEKNCSWEDVWYGDSSLCSSFLCLYRLSRSHNISIKSLVATSSFDWNWNFNSLRNLNEREIKKLQLFCFYW